MESNPYKDGMEYLQRSEQGECLSRYHVEASIVAPHCKHLGKKYPSLISC